MGKDRIRRPDREQVLTPSPQETIHAFDPFRTRVASSYHDLFLASIRTRSVIANSFRTRKLNYHGYQREIRIFMNNLTTIILSVIKLAMQQLTIRVTVAF